jgi:protein tyrosine phosphatase (PTP) superfamily phosphohydrolase (DUF442 family)
MSLAEIKNFAEVIDRIATAGQPTEDQLREVAAAGYSTVVNLGLVDQPYSLPDEAGLVGQLAMTYRHLPVIFDAPKATDYVAFVATMDELASERVFVHCAANYRVSSFIALYGELRLGWTRAQADAHAARFWQPNPTWSEFVAACRALGLR